MSMRLSSTLSEKVLFPAATDGIAPVKSVTTARSANASAAAPSAAVIFRRDIALRSYLPRNARRHSARYAPGLSRGLFRGRGRLWSFACFGRLGLGREFRGEAQGQHRAECVAH